MANQVFNQLIEPDSNNKLTAVFANNWQISVVVTNDTSDVTKTYFTIKENLTDDDSLSIVQITSTGGLLRINKQAAGTSGNGVVTKGTVTTNTVVISHFVITLAAVEAAKPAPANNLFWDIKVIRPSGVNTLTQGIFELQGTPTAATS